MEYKYNSMPESYVFPHRFVHGHDRKKYGLDLFEGDTFLNPDGYRCGIDELVVGIPDAFVDPLDSAKNVDAYDFVAAMVATLHEFRHASQCIMARQGGSVFSDLMLVNELSMVGNSDYYGLNYCKDPSEIDAQHYALREAYHILCDMDGVGSGKANELICMYQNHRYIDREDAKDLLLTEVSDGKMSPDDYEKNEHLLEDFVDMPASGEFSRVRDIFDAYLLKFALSVHEPVLYSVSCVQRGNDSLARYFQDHVGEYNKFCVEKDGYQQAKMAANVYFEFVDRPYLKVKLEEQICSKVEIQSRLRRKRELIDRLKKDRGLDLSDLATIKKPLVLRIASTAPKPGSRRDMAVRATMEVKAQIRRDGLLTDEELAEIDQYNSGFDGGLIK